MAKNSTRIICQRILLNSFQYIIPQLQRLVIQGVALKTHRVLVDPSDPFAPA